MVPLLPNWNCTKALYQQCYYPDFMKIFKFSSLFNHVHYFVYTFWNWMNILLILPNKIVEKGLNRYIIKHYESIIQSIFEMYNPFVYLLTFRNTWIIYSVNRSHLNWNLDWFDRMLISCYGEISYLHILSVGKSTDNVGNWNHKLWPLTIYSYAGSFDVILSHRQTIRYVIL